MALFPMRTFMFGNFLNQKNARIYVDFHASDNDNISKNIGQHAKVNRLPHSLLPAPFNNLESSARKFKSVTLRYKLFGLFTKLKLIEVKTNQQILLFPAFKHFGGFFLITVFE